MSTHTFSVPQPVDALAKIAEIMNSLPFGVLPEARRREIVGNVLGPVVLLIEAVQLVNAAGPDEEAVLMQFIRSLYAQSETAKREQYFAGLLEKLNARRPADSFPN